jgi:hypothetical protein
VEQPVTSPITEVAGGDTQGMHYLLAILPDRDPIDLSERVYHMEWNEIPTSGPLKSAMAVLRVHNKNEALVALLPLQRHHGEFRLVYGPHGNTSGALRREAAFLLKHTNLTTWTLLQTGPEITGTF